jgi:small subunit ribosomal protein S2
MIDFRELVKAGVHFGHQTSRWCPKMAPFIWGHRNNVHLIDVSKTAHQMEKAAAFLENVAQKGRPIMWVGTKKSAQEVIKAAAQRVEMPYVSWRWVGGTLSNYGQVKKSVTKMLHLEDVVLKSEKYPHYTKKELNLFQKQLGRLAKNVGGIRGLTWPVGALVLVDVNKEQAALKEAIAMGVPIVAMVDTNSDPSLVDYAIPSNDDAPRSIKFVIDFLADAAYRGKEKRQQAKLDGTELLVDESVVAEEPGLAMEDDLDQRDKGKRARREADAGDKRPGITKPRRPVSHSSSKGGGKR